MFKLYPVFNNVGAYKKVMAFALCFFMLAGGLAGINNTVASDAGIFILEKSTISLSFDFSEPDIIRNNEYFNVIMDGLDPFGAKGEPILPLKTVEILIPMGHEVINIQVEPINIRDLPGNYIITPGQEEFPLLTYSTQNDYYSDYQSGPITEQLNPKELWEQRGGNELAPSEVEVIPRSDGLITAPNPILYSSSEAYPAQCFESVGVQQLRGYDILIVNLLPVSYIPTSGSISYYKNMELEIITQEKTSFDVTDTLFRGLGADEALVEEWISNPGILKTYECAETLSSSQDNQPTSIVDPADTFEYVIITSTSFLNASGAFNFEDLIASKINKGISATIVTVEDIYADSDYNGIDSQEEIRNFITDAYLNWETEYILLGGDGDGGDVGGESGDTIIPHRGFYALAYGTPDDDIPADVYYACLDGTFDNDGDGIYGETNDGIGGGEVDLLAEVYIGRAPIDSDAEISNFVMKTLAYEGVVDDYLEDVLMLGELLWADPTWGGDYKDEIAYGCWANPPIPGDFNVSTLYDRDLGSPWAPSDIISIINNGVHIINHLGHSNVDYCMRLYNPDVDALTNDKYFFGYSQGCYDGSFDNRDVAGNTLSTDCICEHFVGTPHGAFAFIGNSRYGWGEHLGTNGSSQFFDRKFFDALFGQDIRELGPANQYSKEQNIGLINTDAIRWCYYELILFGDPELSIKDPRAPDHDVAVDDLDVGAYHIQNTSTFVNSTILNQGLNNESNVQVNLTLDGATIDTQTIALLEAGMFIDISFNWTTPSVEGEYLIGIEVVPVPQENITTNNQMFTEVIVGSDIAVTDLVIKNTINVFEPTNINATIENLGLIDEMNISVELSISGAVVDSQTIAVLNAGSSVDVQFVWTPLNTGIFGVEISTVPVFAEAYIDNNAMGDSVLVTYIIFEEDVESGQNGWTNTGLWHISDARASPDISLSPTHSWAYNDGVDYDTGATNSGSVTSPIIDVAWCTDAILKFQGWYETESSGTSYDQRWIYISTDGGAFQPLAQLSGDPMLNWNDYEFNITSYLGDNIQLMFFFDTMDSIWNNFEGWYVDDITVLGNLLDHDIAVKNLSAPNLLEPLDNCWVEAEVSNTGLNNETNIEVDLLIDGFLENSTIIPSLSQGESTVVNFNWIPMIEGNFTITVEALPVANETFVSNNLQSTFVEVKYLPEIWVDPTSYDISVQSGDIYTDTLTVGNNGDGTLFYNITSDASAVGVGGAEAAAHWKMDESFGSIAYDSAGSLDGNITGATINQSGVVGNSFWFDGSDDYVAVPHDDIIDFADGEDFSIYAWINTSASDNGRVFEKRQSGGATEGYVMYITDAGILRSTLIRADSTSASISGPYVADGNWHHVGITQAGNTMEMFVDGASVGTNASAGGDFTNPNTLFIGTDWGTFWDYTGYIDDFRVYNEAISPADIDAFRVDDSLMGQGEGQPLAIVFEDNFDSESPGTTPDNWAADTGFIPSALQVSNAYSKSSPNSMQMTSQAGTSAYSHTNPGQFTVNDGAPFYANFYMPNANGYFAMKTQSSEGDQDAAAVAVQFMFDNSVGSVTGIPMGISYYNGASYVNTGHMWNISTWFEIKIVHDFANNTFDAWKDGVEIVNDGDFFNNQNQAMSMHFYAVQGSNSMYIDDIRVGDATPLTIEFEDNFDAETDGTSPPANWNFDAGFPASNLEVDNSQSNSAPNSMWIRSNAGNSAFTHNDAGLIYVNDDTPFYTSLYMPDADGYYSLSTQSTEGDADTGTVAVQITFDDGAGSISGISQAILYYNGAVFINTGHTWDTATWFDMKIVHDFANNTFDAWKDGAQIVDDGDFRNAGSEVRTMHFYVVSGSHDIYVDDVRIGDAVLPPQNTTGWLTISPDFGTIPAGGNATAQVTNETSYITLPADAGFEVTFNTANIPLLDLTLYMFIPGDQIYLLIEDMDYIANYTTGQITTIFGGVDEGWEFYTYYNYSQSVNSLTHDVIVNATTLDPGFYRANITVSSNDPFNPEIIIPVNLTVLSAPHDIAIINMIVDGDLEAGNTHWINGTILNQGFENETNLQVQFLVDGWLENSTIIPVLDSSQQIIVPFEWVPPAESQYNITLYVVPVAGENITYNNQMSRVINITAEPDIWINPTSFNFTVDAGATDSDIFTIGNDGLANLDYEVLIEGGGIDPNSEILVFADSLPYLANDALDNLGLNYTHTSDPTTFGTLLTGVTDWDLVIVNTYGGTSASYRDSVNDFVIGGGKLIFTDWGVYSYSTHPLLSTMKFSYVSDYTTPIDLYRWDTAHEIFNQPNIVPDLRWSHNQANRDGQKGNAIAPGEAIAGYTGSQSANEGGLFVNDTTTVFNAFQPTNFQYDDDTDGKMDMVELYENEVYYLLAGTGGYVDWLSVAPDTGITEPATSDNVTVTVNTTFLLPGFYQANITVSSNDLDTPEIFIPVNLTVLPPEHDIGVYDLTVPNPAAFNDTCFVNATVVNAVAGGPVTMEIINETSYITTPADEGLEVTFNTSNAPLLDLTLYVFLPGDQIYPLEIGSDYLVNMTTGTIETIFGGVEAGWEFYTYYNYTGFSSPETNITVEFIVDGFTEDSIIVPSLSGGASTSVSFPWIPDIIGNSTVEIYAVPVPGEILVWNNSVSTDVLVIAYPDIWATPTEYNFTLIAGEIGYDNLTIGNDGFSNLFYNITDDLTSYGGDNIVQNPSFETGDFTDWIAQDMADPYDALKVVPAGYSHGFFNTEPTGNYSVVNGFDGGGPDTIYVTQDMTLPQGVTDLTFNYRAGWNNGGTLDRIFTVEIEPYGGGAAMQSVIVLTAAAGTSNPDTGKLFGSIDISAFSGDDIRISFEWFIPESYTGPAQFELDNITINNTFGQGDWLSEIPTSGVLPLPGNTTIQVINETSYITTPADEGLEVIFNTSNAPLLDLTLYVFLPGDQIYPLEPGSDYLVNMTTGTIETIFGGVEAGWEFYTYYNYTGASGAMSTVHDIIADASKLDPGFYQANISIKSNDPDTPVIIIPVNLTVLMPPHDIKVSDMVAPSTIYLGDGGLVNATITNQGLSSESVDVWLMEDGVQIDSQMINVSSGFSVPVIFNYIPAVAGIFNISIYAVPVPGETIVYNNAVWMDVEVIAIPEIIVSPLQYNVSVMKTMTTDRNMTIENAGTLTLDYDITDYVGAASGENYSVEDIGYAWVDGVSGGTPLGLSDDDYDSYALPFTFNFYGVDYNSLYICSNGWISFTYASGSIPSTIPLPTVGWENTIFVLGDDWNPSASGDVYVDHLTSPNRVVVTWNQIAHFGTGGSNTFEVVLYENGDIVCNYQNIETLDSSFTVGVNLGDGIHGTSYGSIPGNNDAIIFHQQSDCPWLHENPMIGNVAPGNADNIIITFDATNLEVGFYMANISIASNDPNTPEVIIPVFLTVTPLPHDLAVENLDVKQIIKINTNAPVNATITNLGTNDESNVQINFLVDGFIEDTNNIAFIGSGNSAPVTFYWMPISEGTYNLEILVVPVPGETVLDNNNQSTTVVGLDPAPILLVDDDEGISSELWFIDAIIANGYECDVWNSAANGTPDLDFMNVYSVVIWFTGNDFDTSLTTEERNLISDYLNGGGKLYLSGMLIGYNAWNNGWTSWYETYLHATIANELIGGIQTFEGIPLDEIGDGMVLDTYIGDYCPELWDYSSWNVPIAPGTSSFNFNATNYSGMTKVDTGIYKLVYSSFEFSGVDGVAERTLLMYRILNWLGIADIEPPQHSNENPAIGLVTDVPRPTVWVHVTDNVEVDASTIRLFVSGFPVFYDIAPIPGGYNVSYVHGGDYLEGDISVRILAEDTSGNVLDFTWFWHLDLSPPEAWDILPAPGSKIFDTNPRIELKVTDIGGVELSTLRLYVMNFAVWYEYNAITDGYHVWFDHPTGYSPGDVIECRIVAEDLFGHWLDQSWNFTIIETQIMQIPVNVGWNLISCPMMLADSSLPNALNDADTSWNTIKYYDCQDVLDPWKSYNLAKPAGLNDLMNVSCTMGLWVHIPDAGSLGDGFIDIEGVMPETTEIPLYTGWNLVGYPSITPILASDTLPPVADMMSVYDAANPYMIRDITDMTTETLNCYNGYWIHVTADAIWVVDA